jgi:hypothetical protein
MSLAVVCVDFAFSAPRDVQMRSVQLETGVVELFNFGAADEPLDGFRFCTHSAQGTRRYTSSSGFNGVTIEAGSSLFIYTMNDSPGGPDDLNLSQVGTFIGPLNTGPYAIGLYSPPADFGTPEHVADHIQWNIDGADNSTADERTDEARRGGIWTDEEAWIATTADTATIVLTDDNGGTLHGPENYEVMSASPPEPPRRSVQIRSLDITANVVEVFNFADVDVSLAGWSFCSHNGVIDRVYTAETTLADVVIEATSSLFIHLGDDAPAGDPDRLNGSDLGDFAGPLDAGPYSLSFYFPGNEPFIDFDDGNLMADHVQWNVDGVVDPVASSRSIEAQAGGVWTDQAAWVATTAETTTRIVLTDDTGAALHGPENYQVVGGQQLFHRGDTTGDGALELTDAVRVFGFLFLGDPPPTCRETADADNTGVIELSDGVVILNFLFLGQAAPADPGPTTSPCGPDPDKPGSPGDLGCEVYDGCADG